ncbi:hypothetical protein TNCV_1980151 [Trichonephila clavipes]|nr:hypothetical protein TNCV_1980151 [Trichonephila clavipes]
MTSSTKSYNSSPHKIFKRRKMLNRLYFPPTLLLTTHIVLWSRTGEPTHDLHPQERQFRSSQNIQKKKHIKRLYFPPTLPHTTHILSWRRTGGPTHDLHHQKRQLRPSQNIQKKKDIKSFYFPPTLPLTAQILLWLRTGEQHMTSIPRATIPALTKYSKEKTY